MSIVLLLISWIACHPALGLPVSSADSPALETSGPAAAPAGTVIHSQNPDRPCTPSRREPALESALDEEETVDLDHFELASNSARLAHPLSPLPTIVRTDECGTHSFTSPRRSILRC